MITAGEETRSESRDTHRNQSTGETGAVTETDTETMQTEGRTQTNGLESVATSEREMSTTSVSSKQRGSFTTKEDESIDKTTKAVVLSRNQNWGSLIANLKKNLL